MPVGEAEATAISFHPVIYAIVGLFNAGEVPSTVALITTCSVFSVAYRCPLLTFIVYSFATRLGL